MEILDPMMGRTPTATAAENETSGRPFEDWIVGTLEGRADQPETGDVTGEEPDAGTLRLDLARRTLCRLPDQARDPQEPKEAKKRSKIGVRVTDIRGLTVVKPMDYAILHDDDLAAIGGELDRLIALGRVRIVLSLGEVHRAASRFLGEVVAAHRRCAEAGGLLKLCGLHPALAELITLTGQGRRFTIVADEPAALDGAWPVPTLRPLPVEALLDLLGRRGPAPGADGPTAELDPSENGAGSHPVETELHVRLIVVSGRSRGKAIPIAQPRFVIGRDARCHLRFDGAGVSRIHAVLERRDGRVFVRDTGSTNGVLLNGTMLWREEAEVADGDRLGIGRLRFTVAIGDRLATDERGVECLVAGWLLGEDGPTADPCAATMMDFAPFVEGESASTSPPSPIPAPAATHPVSLPEMAQGHLTCQVIQDVLVVTLQACLTNDSDIDPIRSVLALLYERPLLPRRVVIDLDGVAAFPTRFWGVLVAHALRLGRAGGVLRLCQPSARVLSVLESIGLPRVIATYLTVDDAVLAA